MLNKRLIAAGHSDARPVESPDRSGDQRLNELSEWGLSWTYDRYGNRTAQTVPAGSGYSASVIVDPSSNRVAAIGGTGLAYDSKWEFDSGRCLQVRLRRRQAGTA